MQNRADVDWVSEPHISHVNVQFALDRLRYTTSNNTSGISLSSLLLVDNFLTRADLSDYREGREYALNHIFTTIIAENYSKLREMLRLSKPQPGENKAQSIERLEEDSLKNNPDLLAWGYLYFQYVRVDLGITLETHGNVLAINVRTLRRYKNHGIKRLTAELISKERQARIKRKRRVMLGQMPQFVGSPHVGRQDVVEYLCNQLVDETPRRIAISGAQGVGKTRLAQHVASLLIHNVLIDRLAWITVSKDASVDSILRDIRQRLSIYSISTKADIVSIERPTLIVIDNHEYVDFETLWASVAEQFTYAHVIFAGQIQPIKSDNIIQIELKEFTFSEVADWLEVNTGKKGKVLLDHAESVWNIIGGNPRNLRRTLEDDVDFARTEFEADIFRAFVELKPSQKELCCLLAILNQSVNIKLLTKWTKADIETLIRINFIDSESNFLSIRMKDFAKNYLQKYYISIREIESAFDSVVAGTLQSNYGERLSLRIAEDILLSGDWLKSNYERVSETLLPQFWEAGFASEHYAAWVQIFATLDDKLDAEQQLNYGIALHAIGSLLDALKVFEQVLHRTGMEGTFELQASAVLMICIIHHQLGNYKEALLGIHVLDEMPALHNNKLLYEQSRCVLAQIAIDRGDYHVAEDLMKTLQQRFGVLSRESLSIAFAVNLYQGKLTKCAEDLPTIMEYPASAPDSALIGQYYDKMGDYELSIDWFTKSMYILENAPFLNIFRLSRIRTNLASVLIKIGEIEEARNLLELALESQTDIQDKLGVIVTIHNLNLINNYHE